MTKVSKVSLFKSNTKKTKLPKSMRLKPKVVNRRTGNKILYENIMDYCFKAMFIIALIQIALHAFVYAADVAGGATTYQYLAEEVYGEHTGPNGPQAQFFLRMSGKILGVILPFMNVFGITFMVISLAASVIYLTRPDWFYEVHMLKQAKKQISNVANPVEKVKTLWREAGGLGNFLKVVLIPDVKELAFSDADELGPEGRPSMAHFFKYKMPKYIMIVSVIMCINDQTILKFLGTSGNAGAYLMRVAADVDYAVVIKSTLEAGKDYDPGYGTVGVDQVTRNKRTLFNNIYKTLKQHNGFVPEKRTDEYLAAMGSAVHAWVEEIAGQVSLDAPKMAVKVVIQPNDIASSPGAVYSKSVASLQPQGDANYVVVNIGFGKTAVGVVYNETTYTAAWNDGGTQEAAATLKLDLTKIGAIGQAIAKSGTDTTVTGSATVTYIEGGTAANGTGSVSKIASGKGTVTVNGTTLTVTAPGNKQIISAAVNLRVTNKKGGIIADNSDVYWKASNLESILSKIKQENKTNKP